MTAPLTARANGETLAVMRNVPGLLLLFIAACSKPPTASAVCDKLVAAGVGKNCRTGAPAGLAAAAKDEAELDLASPIGKTAAVYSFDSDEAYKATVTAFAGVAALAGPHRYGNGKARIFVQMNSEAPNDLGAKAKAVVDAL